MKLINKIITNFGIGVTDPLEKELNKLVGITPFKAPPYINKKIMAEIRSSNLVYNQKSHIKLWTIACIFLLLSVASFAFNETFSWLHPFFGDNFQLTIYFIMGAFITMFIFIFIGSHQNNFENFYNRHITHKS